MVYNARRHVHCEDPFCRLRGKTSDAVHGHVGKGFYLTVGDGCQKLGGHGREMILRRKGNSHLVDVEFKKTGCWDARNPCRSRCP